MSQFQPLIDYVNEQGWQVDINDPDWVQVTPTEGVYFTLNGPGYWSEDDPKWGATIFTGDDEQHGIYDTLPDLIRWLDQNLNTKGV